MNKKHVIVSGILIVLVFIIGYFAGDSAAINRVNKSISGSVANTSNVTSTQTSTPAPAATKEEAKVYNLNEQGKSGNWNIKVLEVKESDSVSSHGDMVKTDQKFIIAKLEMQNNYTAPVQYSILEFALVNKQNNSVYNAELKAAQLLNSDETIYKKNLSFIGVYTDVNPGMAKNTYVSFEVPKDVNISNLILANNNKGSNNVAVGFKLN